MCFSCICLLSREFGHDPACPTFLLGSPNVISEVIQEPLPLKQKIPSGRPAVLLKPFPEQYGEKRFNKSIFAFYLSDRCCTGDRASCGQQPLIRGALTLEFEWRFSKVGAAKIVLLVNCAFGPLARKRGFDKKGEHDELAFQPAKQGLCCSEPLRTTKMTKMADVTWAKVFLFSEKFVKHASSQDISSFKLLKIQRGTRVQLLWRALYVTVLHCPMVPSSPSNHP